MARIRFRIRFHSKSQALVLIVCMFTLSIQLSLASIYKVRAIKPESQATVASDPDFLQFYLTQDYFDSDEAVTACADGYHFASLWEIADPSNLKYNPTLGKTSPDSGQGPPVEFPLTPIPSVSTDSMGNFFPQGLQAITIPAKGWVRTGGSGMISNSVGRANCDAWSSTSDTHWGTAVKLPNTWSPAEFEVGYWSAETIPCDGAARVWCVQDTQHDQETKVYLPLIQR